MLDELQTGTSDTQTAAATVIGTKASIGSLKASLISFGALQAIVNVSEIVPQKHEQWNSSST